MAEGVYALDGEGLLIYMNDAASKMLGWTEEELRGKRMHDTVHYQHIDGTPCREASARSSRSERRGSRSGWPKTPSRAKTASIFPSPTPRRRFATAP